LLWKAKSEKTVLEITELKGDMNSKKVFGGKSRVCGRSPVITILSGRCFGTSQWIVCEWLTTRLVSALFAATFPASDE
jgi:hypothetical protein